MGKFILKIAISSFLFILLLSCAKTPIERELEKFKSSPVKLMLDKIVPVSCDSISYCNDNRYKLVVYNDLSECTSLLMLSLSAYNSCFI